MILLRPICWLLGHKRGKLVRTQQLEPKVAAGFQAEARIFAVVDAVGKPNTAPSRPAAQARRRRGAGMTPLHLEILMWYYSRGNDYPFEGNPTRKDYAEHLVTDGILARQNAERQFFVTEKGKFWIEYVLALPWPKQKWVMPE